MSYDRVRSVTGKPAYFSRDGDFLVSDSALERVIAQSKLGRIRSGWWMFG